MNFPQAHGTKNQFIFHYLQDFLKVLLLLRLFPILENNHSFENAFIFGIGGD